MQDKLNNVIVHSKLSIEERQDHHFILPLRKRLWLAYGPVELEAKNRTRKTPAHACRANLAIRTCKKVLPIWTRNFPKSDVAQRCLEVAEAYLWNRCSFADAQKQANTLAGALGYFRAKTRGELRALLVGHACNSAISVALTDFTCDDADDLDEYLDIWDYSMYAAGAYSGGFPFNTGAYRSDSKRLKAFWCWYLSLAASMNSGFESIKICG